MTADHHVGLADLVLELDLDRSPALGGVTLDEIGHIFAAIDDLRSSSAAYRRATHPEPKIHRQRDRREDGATASAGPAGAHAPFPAAIGPDDEVAGELSADTSRLAHSRGPGRNSSSEVLMKFSMRMRAIDPTT